MKSNRRMTEAEVDRQVTAFLRGVIATLPADTPHVHRQVLHSAAGIALPKEITRSEGRVVGKRSANKPDFVFQMHRDGNGLLTHVTASRASS